MEDLVANFYLFLFRIEFTVVSDPGENDDDDCVDVAHAYVDILQVRLNVLEIFTRLPVVIQA